MIVANPASEHFAAIIHAHLKRFKSILQCHTKHLFCILMIALIHKCNAATEDSGPTSDLDTGGLFSQNAKVHIKIKRERGDFFVVKNGKRNPDLDDYFRMNRVQFKMKDVSSIVWEKVTEAAKGGDRLVFGTANVNHNEDNIKVKIIAKSVRGEELKFLKRPSLICDMTRHLKAGSVLCPYLDYFETRNTGWVIMPNIKDGIEGAQWVDFKGSLYNRYLREMGQDKHNFNRDEAVIKDLDLWNVIDHMEIYKDDKKSANKFMENVSATLQFLKKWDVVDHSLLFALKLCDDWDDNEINAYKNKLIKSEALKVTLTLKSGYKVKAIWYSGFMIDYLKVFTGSHIGTQKQAQISRNGEHIKEHLKLEGSEYKHYRLACWPVPNKSRYTQKVTKRGNTHIDRAVIQESAGVKAYNKFDHLYEASVRDVEGYCARAHYAFNILLSDPEKDILPKEYTNAQIPCQSCKFFKKSLRREKDDPVARCCLDTGITNDQWVPARKHEQEFASIVKKSYARKNKFSFWYSDDIEWLLAKNILSPFRMKLDTGSDQLAHEYNVGDGVMARVYGEMVVGRYLGMDGEYIHLITGHDEVIQSVERTSVFPFKIPKDSQYDKTLNGMRCNKIIGQWMTNRWTAARRLNVTDTHLIPGWFFSRAV